VLRNRVSGYALFSARLFARGAFAGLLGLALAVAVVSFLTACKCDDLFVNPVPLKDGPPPPEQKDGPLPATKSGGN
jgi:hypothetical protein